MNRASPPPAPDADPAQRIAVLDILRGFSLLGIALMNAPAVLRLEFSAEAGDLMSRGPVLSVTFPVLALVAAALTTWQATWASRAPLREVAGLSFDPATLAGLTGAAALVTGVWLLSLTRPDLRLFPALSLLGRMSLAPLGSSRLQFRVSGKSTRTPSTSAQNSFCLLAPLGAMT